MRNGTPTWLPAFFLCSAAIGLAAPDPVDARTVIRVPDDFPTIQTAVDAASPGDIIYVAPGTYCERVVIRKSELRLYAPAAGGGAILDGACLGGTGAGIHVLGSATGAVASVEIMGFVVQQFEVGIHLHYTLGSWVHRNEVRESVKQPTGAGGHGILLEASSLNTVSQNRVHDNGHLGIGVLGTSFGNVIRDNWVEGNNAASAVLKNCNLMVWNGANDNWIVENEVLGTNGTGIMIGPGPAAGNHVEQNRVHGFAGPGIIVMDLAMDNVVEQNDARDNGRLYLSPRNVDLFDESTPVDNAWNRNLGTCGTGIC